MSDRFESKLNLLKTEMLPRKWVVSLLGRGSERGGLNEKDNNYL